MRFDSLLYTRSLRCCANQCVYIHSIILLRAVAVQRVRDPVQEGGAARGGRGGGAGGGGGAGRGRWGGLRVVRLRAAAAAVGLLRAGGRGEGGVLRHVRRRRGGRGRGRAVPAVGARRHAVVAGVRDCAGDAEPVPVLLAST